tara:strand:- start:339 stop:1598 length:1260 start_codon:yes stop_codon:yes gene_type:complete
MITLILFLAIGLLPILVREFRSSGLLMLAYWFVIAIRQGVAFVNTFFFPVPGAESDALRFHRHGELLAESGDFVLATGAKGFENFLAAVYWLFGSSKFLGSQLSILMFAISCVVLIKILRLLELSRYKVSVLLVFGTLPSIVFMGSVTLREAYQVFFFILATYFGLRMLIEKNIRVYGIFMVMSALTLAMFHNGLKYFSVCLISLFMLWNIYPSSGWLAIRKEYFLRVLVILTLILSTIFLNYFQSVDLAILSSLDHTNLWQQALNYQMNSLSVVTRATYNFPIDLSSPFTLAYTSFVLFLHYLFEPFPWHIENIYDVFASMESILRLVLIGFSFKYLCRVNGMQFRLLFLMLILFFTMSFIWAMGTTNYGTAIRHNMVSWWILAITGTPLLMESLNRIQLVSALHRCMRFLGQAKKIP